MKDDEPQLGPEAREREFKARKACRRAGWFLSGSLLALGLLLYLANSWGVKWIHPTWFALHSLGTLLAVVAIWSGVNGCVGLSGRKGFGGEKALGCGASLLGSFIVLTGVVAITLLLIYFLGHFFST